MTPREKQMEARISMLEQWRIDVMKKLGMEQDEIDSYERREAIDQLVETRDKALLCAHLRKINGRKNVETNLQIAK